MPPPESDREAQAAILKKKGSPHRILAIDTAAVKSEKEAADRAFQEIRSRIRESIAVKTALTVARGSRSADEAEPVPEISSHPPTQQSTPWIRSENRCGQGLALIRKNGIDSKLVIVLAVWIWYLSFFKFSWAFIMWMEQSEKCPPKPVRGAVE